jgi:GDP-4-dehydro-6-deoxy-D-mannose reductase
MKTLVTGADGFAGSHLVKALIADGHQVTGTRLENRARSPGFTPEEFEAVRWIPMDLSRSDSVRDAVNDDYEAVVHLAAVSASADAGADAGFAWEVNAGGTARLLDRLVQIRSTARILIASSSVVYGEGQGRAAQEDDSMRPMSAYAATKLGTEVCAGQFARLHHLPLVVARPWPHTGPFQQPRRLFTDWVAALRRGEREIRFGDPQAVRDYLDVRDVVLAYLALLQGPVKGGPYNVASGRGRTFQEMFDLLAGTMGVAARLVPAPERRRGWDEQYSVGDPARITRDTGWAPRYDLATTLRDLVHAQTH